MRAQLSRWQGPLFLAAGAVGLLSVLHGELAVGDAAANDLAGALNALLYQGGNILASLGMLGLGARLRDGGGRLRRSGVVAAILCGAAATLAIVAHAVPQQVGDFAILVHSGYSRRRAFATNTAAGLATLAGALLAYFALADMQRALPVVLAIAASSLLYVAVADLIPSLHRRPEPIETAKQSALIAAGIAVIALVRALFET